MDDEDNLEELDIVPEREYVEAFEYLREHGLFEEEYYE